MGLLYSSISDSHAFFFTKEGKTFLDEKRIWKWICLVAAKWILQLRMRTSFPRYYLFRK
jgi:hypothetical protein